MDIRSNESPNFLEDRFEPFALSPYLFRVCLIRGFWRGGDILNFLCLVLFLRRGRGENLDPFLLPPKLGDLEGRGGKDILL
jgi:hypothetical protein